MLKCSFKVNLEPVSHAIALTLLTFPLLWKHSVLTETKTKKTACCYCCIFCGLAPPTLNPSYLHPGFFMRIKFSRCHHPHKYICLTALINTRMNMERADDLTWIQANECIFRWGVKKWKQLTKWTEMQFMYFSSLCPYLSPPFPPFQRTRRLSCAWVCRLFWNLK